MSWVWIKPKKRFSDSICSVAAPLSTCFSSEELLWVSFTPSHSPCRNLTALLGATVVYFMLLLHINQEVIICNKMHDRCIRERPFLKQWELVFHFELWLCWLGDLPYLMKNTEHRVTYCNLSSCVLTGVGGGGESEGERHRYREKYPEIQVSCEVSAGVEGYTCQRPGASLSRTLCHLSVSLLLSSWTCMSLSTPHPPAPRSRPVQPNHA